jgi:hypothetical protein
MSVAALRSAAERLADRQEECHRQELQGAERPTVRSRLAIDWRSMERVIGFEPTTSCLASMRSTN